MAFRLILQPMMAIFLAFRAGVRDAREGRRVYGWALMTHVGRRLEYLRDGWKDIAKVFTVALIIDCIYQIIVVKWIYPTQALVVAAILAVVPYLLVRGPISRIVRQHQRY